MTPHEINGIWFDLDHVQAVTPVVDSFRFFGQPVNPYSFEFGLVMAFRDKPFPLNFSYRLGATDSESLPTREEAEAKAEEVRSSLIGILERKGEVPSE